MQGHQLTCPAGLLFKMFLKRPSQNETWRGEKLIQLYRALKSPAQTTGSKVLLSCWHFGNSNLIHVHFSWRMIMIRRVQSSNGMMCLLGITPGDQFWRQRLCSGGSSGGKVPFPQQRFVRKLWTFLRDRLLLMIASQLFPRPAVPTIDRWLAPEDRPRLF